MYQICQKISSLRVTNFSNFSNSARAFAVSVTSSDCLLVIVKRLLKKRADFLVISVIARTKRRLDISAVSSLTGSLLTKFKGRLF